MSARDWFGTILAWQRRLDNLEDAIASAYSAAGPHGQQLGSIGGGGSSRDALAGVDSVIDSDAMRERDSLRAKLEQRLERATDVLYGKSGNGGLAKARGSDYAYILDLHYLQGIGWAQMAMRYVKVEGVADPADHLRIMARGALRYVDRVSMDALADT